MIHKYKQNKQVSTYHITKIMGKSIQRSTILDLCKLRVIEFSFTKNDVIIVSSDPQNIGIDTKTRPLHALEQKIPAKTLKWRPF